jgi:hypothetical protein
MKPSLYILLILCVAMLCVNARGQNSKYDTWNENYAVQALLGAIKYKDLEVEDTEGSGDPIKIDVSAIPQLGGAWMTLPKGERFQYGLECSFLLGFRIDSVNAASVGGNGLYISLSTSMWMFDLAGGGYASLFLDKNEKFRIYAGAGPLMTYVDYRSEREETPDNGPTESFTTNESAFGLGVYARTGFEFRVHEAGMLGLGVRGTWSNVDLSEVSSGSSELVGTAAFVTYTAGF